ncbi:hypothetical protein RRG08_058557 [Elysia crispata]|uniref:Uncharacterized protein n=1 Tax=Elysia crispata TaxID=231223 RepID=A0AAE0XVI4_9GAST|nr:hypothetical protein RRG08_058557 [Elysia crispata]
MKSRGVRPMVRLLKRSTLKVEIRCDMRVKNLHLLAHVIYNCSTPTPSKVRDFFTHIGAQLRYNDPDNRLERRSSSQADLPLRASSETSPSQHVLCIMTSRECSIFVGPQ